MVFLVVNKEMMTLRICIFLIILGISYGINNGLGRTPQMGEFDSEMIFDMQRKEKS